MEKRPLILTHYHKILSCITSCTTIEQLPSMKNMIEGFSMQFKQEKECELLTNDLLSILTIKDQDINYHGV